MSRANWDFESEAAPCKSRLGELVYLGIATLLLMAVGGYHWQYSMKVATTIENQTQLLAKYEEKNQIYEKMTRDMESTLHKQEKLIDNMGTTLDQQDHLLKEFAVGY